MTKEAGGRTIAQFEVIGKKFHRILDGELPELTNQERRVRIVGVLNEVTGDMEYYDLNNLPAHVHPDTLIHIPVGQVNTEIDLAFEGSPKLSTVLKRGASKSGIDMDEVYKSRGGDPNYRPLKTGFKLKR